MLAIAAKAARAGARRAGGGISMIGIHMLFDVLQGLYYRAFHDFCSPHFPSGAIRISSR